MPPKINFVDEDDQVIIELFCQEHSCKNIEKIFRKTRNKSISYKLLKSRYEYLKQNENNSSINQVDTQPSTSKQADVNEKLSKNSNTGSRITITRIISRNKIIKSNIHQGIKSIFGIHVGNQCTAIVLYAMFNSTKIPVTEWNTEVIDSVLYEGNEFYVNILNEKNMPIRFLGVDDLIGTHVVFDDTYFVDQYEMYPNILNDKSELFQSLKFSHNGQIDYDDIINQFRTLTEANCNFAFFICNGYTYGLIKNQNVLYLFDSHAKNDAGDTVDDGYASLRSFVSLDELVNYMLKINRFKSFYQIDFLTISNINMSTEFSLTNSISTMSINDESILSVSSSESFNIDTNIKKKRKNRNFLTFRGENDYKKKVKKTYYSREKGEKKELRLQLQKQITYSNRSDESSASTISRLNEQKIRTNYNRINETNEQTFMRLEKQKHITINNRLNETNEQTSIRLEKQKQISINNRLNETNEQTSIRLEKQKKISNNNRINETNEQTLKRLENQINRTNKNRSLESAEEYRERLDNQQIINLNRNNETTDQRENRLKWQRNYQRERREKETEQDRMIRLQLEKQKRTDKKYNVNTLKIAEIDNETVVNELKVGTFNKICKFCNALFNELETTSRGVYMRCCENGKIAIPFINYYHETMKELLVTDSVYQKHFLENIRQYNSLMAFAGIKTQFDRQNYDNEYNNRRPYLYKCHGAMYFNIPPMFNDDEDPYPPQTAQFYVMDSNTANLQRTQAWRNDNGDINKHVLDRLEEMIYDVNPICHLFRSQSEELRMQLQINPTECCFWLQRQTFNLRGDAAIARQAVLNSDVVGGEVAAVFKDTNSGLPPEGIKVAIYPRKGHRQLLHICDPNVDPMCFPLLFPFGEAGFRLNIPHAKITSARNRVTPKEFYKHRIHFRNDNENLINLAGKLFQEYVVHAWIKIESNNLTAIRRLQGQMRIADYNGLMNHDSTKYTPKNINLGKGRAVVLNSNYPGSDRNMKQNYYDAMQIAIKFGRVDFFITFTSNPKWPEIAEFLRPGITYLDRPDICSRVYEMKRNHFKQIMLKEHIMGVVKAYIDAKEYQLRGLPHDHTLWWLRDEDKIRSGDDIDRYIRAELPDEQSQPELFELVTKYMLHGPCTKDKPCMKKDGIKCSKGFPKPYSNETRLVANGFPEYRRRNDGRAFRKNGQTFTNQHVVPYNPYLLMVFRSHINVEYCGNLGSIAYVMKYVCKGNDRVNAVQNVPSNVNSADIEVPVVTLNETPFIEDLIVDETDYENAEASDIEDEEVEREIPLHDNNLYIDQNELAELINQNEDDSNVDINNYIDEVQINGQVDVNNNDSGTIDNNFNRAVNFVAYDEIKQYEVCRYVSSIEAVDRILGFVRTDLSHTIYRLTIHLPNQQNIIFNENDVITAKDINNRKTMLLAWFELNKKDPEARELYYKDIPEFYVYDNGTGEWTPRKQGEVISRLHFINPRNQELFHLRILLLHVRGATSFEYLRKVNGIVLNSFTLAARALNLVDNDRQWNDFVEELLNNERAFNARFSFTLMLIHCMPSSPNAIELWEQYKVELCQDFIQHNNSEYIGVQQGLQHIDYICKRAGSSLKDIGLPEADKRVQPFNMQNFVNCSKTPDEYLEEAEAMHRTLNAEQLNTYNAVYEAALRYNDPNAKCFFVDGPGGTGKTYLIRCLLNMLKGYGRTVIPAAFTGIAASLIEDGQTIHTRFKIPVPTESDSESTLKEKFELQSIKYSSLIIIDEASMVSKHLLGSLDRLLRRTTNNNVPFGGKCIMLAGDFRQCAPVSDLPQIVDSSTESIKYSDLWQYFTRFSLITNVRADPQEYEFKDWSLRVGNGIEETIDNLNLIRLPDRVICENNIVFDIFGEDVIRVDDIGRQNTAILCPTNKDSLEINDVIVRRLEGDEIEYISVTRIECDDPVDEEMYPIENAFEETPNGYPPHRLIFKIGAIVILLKNWCVQDGLCNGTRLRVLQCNRCSVKCAILYGPKAGNEYTFSRCVFRPRERNTDPVKIIRTQLPFRLAFAMTINKSQGQTFDRVGLLLREPVFSHGQLYVAISRVRRFDSLKVLVVDVKGGSKQQGIIESYEGVYTKNVVDKSLL